MYSFSLIHSNVVAAVLKIQTKKLTFYCGFHLPLSNYFKTRIEKLSKIKPVHNVLVGLVNRNCLNIAIATGTVELNREPSSTIVFGRSTSLKPTHSIIYSDKSKVKLLANYYFLVHSPKLNSFFST